jgi:hypothetical protein
MNLLDAIFEALSKMSSVFPKTAASCEIICIKYKMICIGKFYKVK